MSAQNDDIVGGQQSPAIAYALGNIDDTSLPVHLRLRVPVRATKPKHKEENPKFNCPRRECKEGFRSKDELEKHQWKRCHYRCIECELDFHDAEAQFAHNSKAHKQPQDLTCPGCGAECDTAGKLMGHIEENRCPRISPSTLHERRQKQITFSQKLRTMNPANDEFQFVCDMKNLEMTNDKPVLPEPSGAFNPPHMQPDARVPNYLLSIRDFPELGKSSNDHCDVSTVKPDIVTGETRIKVVIPAVKKFESRWVKGETLFQDSAPALHPITSQLDGFNAAAPSSRDIKPSGKVTDPNDSGFNAAAFYHPILQQFVCAHAPKCKSKFQSAKGLTAHLNSKAHRDAVIFKCPRCLRDYKTMASAMAHAENATRICNIRETEDFRKFVNHISGGMLDGLNGKDECLKDGGPRFIIPKVFYETLPFPAHIRYNQTEQDANLGRGRMAEWNDSEEKNSEELEGPNRSRDHMRSFSRGW